MFMESSSLVGVDVPGEADTGTNVSFVFTNNHIHYANKVTKNLRESFSSDESVTINHEKN